MKQTAFYVFFFFFFVSESGSCCYAHAFGRSPCPHWKQHLCFKGLPFIHGHPCHAVFYQLDLVLGLPRLNCGEWHSVGSPNANFSWSCTEKAHLDPPPAQHGSCSATLVSFENSFSLFFLVLKARCAKLWYESRNWQSIWQPRFCDWVLRQWLCRPKLLTRSQYHVAASNPSPSSLPSQIPVTGRTLFETFMYGKLFCLQCLPAPIKNFWLTP